MRGQEKNLKDLRINKDWTLFLDRDGVINKKIENDYVRNWSQFEFIEGVIEALKILRNIFVG
jgi:D-glycero-D-manno-heptose 1,7-bisphosphate phosphatase